MNYRGGGHRLDFYSAMLLFAPLLVLLASHMQNASRIFFVSQTPMKILTRAARTSAKIATRQATSDMLDMHALLESRGES